jgi:alcohol oxidase
MKSREDGGVVDKFLTVYGTENLKVAGKLRLIFGLTIDLSICPSIIGGNTCNTALVIGEKATLIIAEEFNLLF